MLILFDHGTPAPLIPFLEGHTVTKAMDAGWDKLANGELLKAAEEAGFELLLTTDKNMAAQQNWWPLPWYLRRFERVRWWGGVPEKGRTGPIVLCSPETEAAVARLLYEGPPPGERELFLNLFAGPIWLRPGVEVRGYVAAGAALR